MCEHPEKLPEPASTGLDILGYLTAVDDRSILGTGYKEENRQGPVDTVMKRLSVHSYDSSVLAADNSAAPANFSSEAPGVLNTPVAGNVTANAVKNPKSISSENVFATAAGNVTAIENETPSAVAPENLKPAPKFERGVVIAYVACIFIWGTTWFAVRQCVLPGAFGPFTACAWRFVFATIAIAAIFATGLIKAPWPDKRTMAWTVLCSVLSVISFAFVYSAEKYVSGGLAAIISTTTPVLTAVAATLTRTEKVTREQVIGLLISMVGILLIFGDRLNVSAEQGEGVLFLICSVVLTSVSGVILKRHTTKQNPFVSVAIFIAVCAVAFIGLSIFREGGAIFAAPPMVPALAAAYLGVVSSIISFACYFYLLKRISLMALSKLVFFPPIIALVVDGFFETRVTLSIIAYVGIAITLLGVAAKVPAFSKRR